MLLGYIRPDKRFSAEAQIAIVLAAGVLKGKLWQEAERARDDEYAEMNYLLSNSLRSGDKDVVVVSDFHRLASTADDLKRHIAGIKAKGATILEARTKRSSANPPDLADMIFEAMAFYANRGLGPAAASARGKAGADASPVTKRKKFRLPKVEAMPIWRDPALYTDEAIAKINNSNPEYKGKWTKPSAHRLLGPRGVSSGPKPKGWRKEATFRKQKAAETPIGMIYFLRAAGKGPVKIGFSTDVKARQKMLATSHHAELELVAMVEGTQIFEGELHRRFANYRVKREWFKFEGAVRKYIESLPKTNLK